MELKINRASNPEDNIFEVTSTTDLEYVTLVALDRALDTCELGGISILATALSHVCTDGQFTLCISSKFVHYIIAKFFTDKWLDIEYIKKLQTIHAI